MNVLLCGDSSGGPVTFLRTLARELDRRGCQVTLALSGPTRPRSVGAESVELAWRPGKVEWMREPWADVDATGTWLLELAQLRQAEVVHVNSYSQATLPFDAPVVLTAHSDALTRSRAVGGTADGPDLETYTGRVRAALESDALVVAPTAAHLAAMEAEFGPLAGARVIHEGSAPLAPAGSKQQLVLAAGRVWDEGDNLSALRGVQLPRRWNLAIAGPRRHPDGGSAAVPGTRLLGELDDADCRAWLARAAIFVDPALYKPFGLAVLEAAQAGCALLLADIPTLRELWNGAAVFFDPRDRHALETALWLLATDEPLREELSRRAAERSERYTAAAAADAYLGAYLALAQRRALQRAS